MQKKYYSILSFDASKIYAYKETGLEIPVKGTGNRVDPHYFNGVLDESLETKHLKKVTTRHFPKIYKYEKDGDNGLCTAVIQVSFDKCCKQFFSYDEYARITGRKCKLYVKTGAKITEEDIISESSIKDHILWKDGVIVAVEVPYSEKDTEDYTRVKKNRLKGIDNIPFEYKTGCYFLNSEKNKSEKPQNTEFLRKELYSNGFFCNGEHYVRYKRSAGSSREGNCLFISEKLYKPMMEWSSCGLAKEKITDRVAWEAYISLTLSEMIETVELKKENVFILRDAVSCFDEKVVSVTRGTENDKDLDAKVSETTIENIIWDGEGLIDDSVFSGLSNKSLQNKGMILLRNRFLKTCAFRTYLQRWFSDNGITSVEQLNLEKGFTLAKSVEDIKLVITQSSLKYLKLKGIDKKSSKKEFNAACEQWLMQMEESFGVVKTDKPTKFMDGDMVQTNYQILNTIDIGAEEAEELLALSRKYHQDIRRSPEYLRHYMGFAEEDSEDADGDDFDTADEAEIDFLNYRMEATRRMLKYGKTFSGTKPYQSLKGDLLKAFRANLRRGKIRIHGTYATIFGNRAEFLEALIKNDYDFINPKIKELYGEEICCSKFEDGIELFCARSPHITMGNLMLARNKKDSKYSKYFNLSDEIVCVNSIGNNIQQRLNGCDYDSDTMLITDNAIMLEVLKKNYKRFFVPFCNVKESKDNDIDEKQNKKTKSESEIDKDISDNLIGEITNLSQQLNSIYWDTYHNDPQSDKLEKIYMDICKLAVLCGMEIDKAKRSYPTNPQKVLNSLRGDYGDVRVGIQYSKFFECMTDAKKKREKTGQTEEQKKKVVDNIKKARESVKTAMYYIFDEAYKRIYKGDGEDENDRNVSLCSLADEAKIERLPKNAYRIVDDIVDRVEKDHSSLTKLSREKRLGMDTDDYPMEREKIVKECFAFVKEKIEGKNGKREGSDRNAIIYRLLDRLDKSCEKGSKDKIKGESLLFAAICLACEYTFFGMLKSTGEPVKTLRKANAGELATDYIYAYPFVRV